MIENDDGANHDSLPKKPPYTPKSQVSRWSSRLASTDSRTVYSPSALPGRGGPALRPCLQRNRPEHSKIQRREDHRFYIKTNLRILIVECCHHLIPWSFGLILYSWRHQ